jgi:hypothetical protein
MLTLDPLFAADETAAKRPKISGKWFEIQLAPDLVSGERLNIGVGFIQARTRKFFFRLLDTPAPFACLYGPGAREQFGFLLRVVCESLEQHGPNAGISEQISFGVPRAAQGDSPQEIVDAFYQSVVTLGRRAQMDDADAPTPAERTAPRSTESIRKRIRRAFRSNDRDGFGRYWRDESVVLPIGNARHRIDLPIWQDQQELFSPRCFASIVSACYRNSHYRDGYLKGAYHGLTIARSYTLGSAKGGVFILRPTEDPTIPNEMKLAIDNEIDDVTWVLKEKFAITPYVRDTLARIKEDALAFVL